MRIVYPSILDINYFCHFLDILRNYDPIDDEPMWAADHVVAPTPGFAITIPETANEFAIKGNHLTLVKGNQFDGNSNSDTDKIMARMDAMTIKMDAQYKELQSRAKQPTSDLDDNDMPMSREEEAKFMQTFEDFDALLDEGSKILHSIKGTLLEEEIFSEFDEFIAMTADENYESESDTEEPPFEKITINTDYKIKTSLEEPPMDIELKPLPDNLEYVFLEEPSFLPVIISFQLFAQNKSKHVSVLKNIRKPFLGKRQTFLVSPIHCVPKKGGITIVINENDELVLTRTVTGNKYFCFLDGFSGYFQIPIDPMDQEKATFTCPFGTYAYRRMPFRLCNAPTTFQRCMLAIFHDMIEEFVEVFMDDFSVFGDSFDKCLNNIDKILQRCEDAHLVLNWEKCHFMIKEGIVLGLKVSGAGLEVDKAKIDVISKLPPLLTSKVLKAFLDMPILLLQEFDIEIKDRKGKKNVAADHLSWMENDESSDDSEMDDNFPGETLMEISTKDEPWFVDFANYLVADIIPKEMTYQQKNKFFSDLKHYFWEEPYLFKVCSDGMIRRCVSGPETRTILDQCHHGPTSGYYGPNVTAKKVLDSGFY
ncbi:reverse transcriptase domain-containing protein [Tanacetum coccineum]